MVVHVIPLVELVPAMNLTLATREVQTDSALFVHTTTMGPPTLDA